MDLMIGVGFGESVQTVRGGLFDGIAFAVE